MKLPFNIIIAPMIKPYLGRTRSFCEQLAFSFSIPYTYIYSTLGIFISANHLRRHLGEGLAPALLEASDDVVERDCMLVHDLRIIATSMGLVQYICLLAGCYTENPALFLPHLTGQLVVVAVKIMNTMLLLTHLNLKTFNKLKHRVPAIILMAFNWVQEFCVFRKCLCVCDL